MAKRLPVRGPGGRMMSAEAFRAAGNAQLNGSIDVVRIVNQLRKDVDKELSNKLRRFLYSVKKDIQKQAELKQIHEEIGKGAQRKVAERYMATHSGNKPYRQDDEGALKRYSGGKMLKALEGPGFYKADGRRLQMINPSVLDRQAKQWYRLNFGAKPAATPEADVGSMRFKPRMGGGKQKTFKGVDLARFSPSESFLMPLSVFSGDRRRKSAGSTIRPTPHSKARGQAMYLVYSGVRIKSKDPRASYKAKTWRRDPKNSGKTIANPTAGIKGKRFLDEGAKYINDEYPDRLVGMFDKWGKDAIRKSKAASKR